MCRSHRMFEILIVNGTVTEYWITAEDASYNALMKDVSNFIQSPGAADVPVQQVFTQQMFDEGGVGRLRPSGGSVARKLQGSANHFSVY